MESRLSYTLVGLFVLVLGSGIIAVTLWLAAGIEDKDYTRYVAYVTESVSGLNPRAPVKTRVGVGLVSGIELDRQPRALRLLLDIETGTPDQDRHRRDRRHPGHHRYRLRGVVRRQP